MSFYLAIVSPLDAPLYELQFQSQKPTSTPVSGSGTFPSWSSFTTGSGSTSNTSNGNGDGNGSGSGDLQNSSQIQGQGGGKLGGQLGLISNSSGPGLERHLAQMVAFAALDSVDEVLESTGSLYVSPLLVFKRRE